VAACRAAVAETCRSSGRAPEEVLLVAAIKSADTEEINYIHRSLGVSDVGENRVQQLLERYDSLDRAGMRIHFIGTLQTNKVKYIIDKVDMIQSLDSERLAKEIQKQAKRVGRVMDVLVEINAGEELAKSGVMPADAEALAVLISGEEYPNLRLCGFMTMAPRCETDGEYRAYFGDTRRLCEHIWHDVLERRDRMVLSMGMSESYLPAVSEGATMVRVGRGLFKKPDSATQTM
jgi:pyridoxal phosphate enzyme (YggS family)